MIVDVLAAARLTRLVTRDRITRPAREAVERLEARGRLPLGAWDFVNCPWCVGLWVSGAVLLARKVAPRAWRPLAVVLAASEVAGLLAPMPSVEPDGWQFLADEDTAGRPWPIDVQR